MDLQDWLVIGFAFLAGSGLGSTSVLFCQWIVRRFRGDGAEAHQLRDLGAGLADLDSQLTNVDARLDFTEKLLGGALTTATAPPRRLRIDDGSAGAPFESDHSSESPSDADSGSAEPGSAGSDTDSGLDTASR